MVSVDEHFHSFIYLGLGYGLLGVVCFVNLVTLLFDVLHFVEKLCLSLLLPHLKRFLDIFFPFLSIILVKLAFQKQYVLHGLFTELPDLLIGKLNLLLNTLTCLFNLFLKICFLYFHLFIQLIDFKLYSLNKITFLNPHILDLSTFPHFLPT